MPEGQASHVLGSLFSVVFVMQHCTEIISYTIMCSVNDMFLFTYLSKWVVIGV